MIVNTATSNDVRNQVNGLKQLQDANSDSLVIILFPSNSFGNENMPDSLINNYYKNNIGFNGVIAQKTAVTGTNMHPVFRWLTTKTQNGEGDATIAGDFQKFLISSQGEIIGYFSSKVNPNVPVLAAAIRRPF